MYDAAYYRRQAERARRMARAEPGQAMRTQLMRIAKDFDALAEEIEKGMIKPARPPESG